MTSRENSLTRIAIVGASSLRGKELNQVLEDRQFPAADTVLLDTTVPVGTLAAAAGEPTFVKPMEPESFEGARFVFFAGGAEEAEKNWKLAQASGATIIDLTGALEDSAGAAPWIPDLDVLLAPPEKTAAKSGGELKGAQVFSSPAPGVIIACTLAAALDPFSPARLAMLFFPPVSEREQPGIDELEKQTADLLLLRPISQLIFDAQVAFNLLTGYGQASRPGLQETGTRLAHRITAYLDGRAKAPAVQLIQAPTFYGYAFAVFAEFSAAPDIGKLESALARAGIRVAAEGDPRPSNISVAGEDKIYLARIHSDRNVPHAVWLWGAADNLRLSATNAGRIAEELLAPKI